jgi:hypothetical protein
VFVVVEGPHDGRSHTGGDATLLGQVGVDEVQFFLPLGEFVEDRQASLVAGAGE